MIVKVSSAFRQVSDLYKMSVNHVYILTLPCSSFSRMRFSSRFYWLGVWGTKGTLMDTLGGGNWYVCGEGGNFLDLQILITPLVFWNSSSIFYLYWYAAWTSMRLWDFALILEMLRRCVIFCLFGFLGGFLIVRPIYIYIFF